MYISDLRLKRSLCPMLLGCLLHFTTELKICFAMCQLKLHSFNIPVNSFPGQRSTTHREPQCAPVSSNTQLSPAQNGLHPSTHSIHNVSVLSSISPAIGYFGEQEGQDSTQNSVIPQQVNSLHGAEALSSKQH